ncbi:hypothetical protein RvY_17888, partial [Ramazzottius varieornatus]
EEWRSRLLITWEDGLSGGEVLQLVEKKTSRLTSPGSRDMIP